MFCKQFFDVGGICRACVGLVQYLLPSNVHIPAAQTVCMLKFCLI